MPSHLKALFIQTACVTFIVQQGRLRHCQCMPFAALFNGTLMPILLMLSPLAVMAASHVGEGHRTAKTDAQRPCLHHRLLLM